MKTFSILALALALSACGGGDAGQSTAAIRTATGSLTLDHAMPKLPAWAPAYPGATVIDSVVGRPVDGAKDGGMLTLATPAAPAAVIAFYEKSAAAAGLREAQRNADGADVLAVFNRPGAKQSFNVDAQPNDSGPGTKITLMY